jgi:hypothetical protein
MEAVIGNDEPMRMLVTDPAGRRRHPDRTNQLRGDDGRWPILYLDRVTAISPTDASSGRRRTGWLLIR